MAGGKKRGKKTKGKEKEAGGSTPSSLNVSSSAMSGDAAESSKDAELRNARLKGSTTTNLSTSARADKISSTASSSTLTSEREPATSFDEPSTLEPPFDPEPSHEDPTASTASFPAGGSQSLLSEGLKGKARKSSTSDIAPGGIQSLRASDAPEHKSESTTLSHTSPVEFQAQSEEDNGASASDNTSKTASVQKLDQTIQPTTAPSFDRPQSSRLEAAPTELPGSEAEEAESNPRQLNLAEELELLGETDPWETEDDEDGVSESSNNAQEPVEEQEEVKTQEPEDRTQLGEDQGAEKVAGAAGAAESEAATESTDTEQNKTLEDEEKPAEDDPIQAEEEFGEGEDLVDQEDIVWDGYEESQLAQSLHLTEAFATHPAAWEQEEKATYTPFRWILQFNDTINRLPIWMRLWIVVLAILYYARWKTIGIETISVPSAELLRLHHDWTNITRRTSRICVLRQDLRSSMAGITWEGYANELEDLMGVSKFFDQDDWDDFRFHSAEEGTVLARVPHWNSNTAQINHARNLAKAYDYDQEAQYAIWKTAETLVFPNRVHRLVRRLLREPYNERTLVASLRNFVDYRSHIHGHVASHINAVNWAREQLAHHVSKMETYLQDVRPRITSADGLTTLPGDRAKQRFPRLHVVASSFARSIGWVVAQRERALQLQARNIKAWLEESDVDVGTIEAIFHARSESAWPDALAHVQNRALTAARALSVSYSPAHRELYQRLEGAFLVISSVLGRHRAILDLVAAEYSDWMARAQNLSRSEEQGAAQKVVVSLRDLIEDAKMRSAMLAGPEVLCRWRYTGREGEEAKTGKSFFKGKGEAASSPDWVRYVLLARHEKCRTCASETIDGGDMFGSVVGKVRHSILDDDELPNSRESTRLAYEKLMRSYDTED